MQPIVVVVFFWFPIQTWRVVQEVQPSKLQTRPFICMAHLYGFPKQNNDTHHVQQCELNIGF
jgi:hypothetical protein